MKKFVIMFAALLFMQPSYAKADVTLKLVSPVDAVKSAGGFVLDTGKKVCEGITTTAFGIGEVITAHLGLSIRSQRSRPISINALVLSGIIHLVGFTSLRLLRLRRFRTLSISTTSNMSQANR